MWLFSLIITILGWLSGQLVLWQVPQVKEAPEPGGAVEPKPGAAPQGRPAVSVIIPARNEALRIAPLLESLARQSLLALEVLVVDDHSTDETITVARAAGATVIASDPIQDGWIGKTRACWSGACAARGDILVFFDADTWLEQPDSLGQLVAAFQFRGGRGLLSVQPYHRVKRLYESFSAIFNIIVLAGLNRFTIWGDRLPGAGAFGPCMVLSRSDYFAVGGHEAVKGAVMDDLALGQRFSSEGLPVHCLAGRDVIAFRMYPEGFGQLFEGWTKNFGTASASTHPLVMMLIILWVGGGISSVTGLWQAQVNGPEWAFPAAVAALVLFMAGVFAKARQAGQFHAVLLIFYPLLFIFFGVLYAWSLFLTKVLHTVSWRGRKIKV